MGEVVTATVTICKTCHRFAMEGQTIPNVHNCPDHHRHVVFIPIMIPLT